MVLPTRSIVTMANNISIAGRRIGASEPPYVVAELSGNHLGDIERAFALMEAVSRAGADAVKIQTYTADTITIDHDGSDFRIEEGPWAGRTLHDLYQEAHTPWDWHEALFEKARRLGLTIFSSPFDPTAVAFLNKLDAPAYKVASFELIDLPLIACMAQTGKPLIMSTGLATAEEIGEAVDAARGAGCTELALLHCTSGYPTPAEEANLAILARLSERFDVVVGLSDHTLGAAVAISAVALGAAIVEKHVALSRADGGPDAGFSLEPDEFSDMAGACRVAWRAIGSPEFRRTPSESENLMFRRSLYVVRDIKAGDKFSEQNLRSIRPGHGLAPKHLPSLLGSRAARDLARGTAIGWDDVADKGREL